MKTLTLKNTASPLKNFLVRIVAQGDGYGRHTEEEGYALTHKSSEPLVEFYDLDYDKSPVGGQFIARYFIETLLEVKDRGLCLDGGEPKWNIDYMDMAQVRSFLKAYKHQTNYTPEPSIDELFEVAH